MPLSDLKVRTATPSNRSYKLADGGGLYLLVQPTGSKLWRLKYRCLGKEKLLSLGKYPDVGLAKARKERQAAKELLASGDDPGEAKRAAIQAKIAEQERTFAALAALFLEKQAKDGRAASTLSKNKWVLDMAGNDLGRMPVASIKAADILAALMKVEARGIYETARRMKVLVGSVLRYGVSLGWIDYEPTASLRGALAKPPAKNHAAITDPQAFGALLRAIDGFSGQASNRIGLQLLALLYPRPGELRLAKWEEFDLDRRVWTIPAERTKMRRPHRVPLPEAAIDLLKQLKALNSPGEYLFPSIRTWKKPISDATFTAALRRLGYTGDEATAHGFRASFSTIANESGLWNPDAIARALAHVEANAVRAAYSRSDFWDERVRIADWWAGVLAQLRQNKGIIQH
ncbi:MAG: integrase arm-type DNA-binding domain-containing protein [Pseudomonadota bacterium]